MSGDVEVLIAHRNNLAKLRRCLDALERQTVPAGVCVIDDASTDESPRAIPSEYPRVRYLRLDENVGFSRANNRGIASSAAPWVVLLNNDTVPEPNFVETLRDAWESSGAEMVAATLRRPDGTIDSAGIEVDRSLVAFDLLHGEQYDPVAIARLAPLAPCAGAGAYRRDALVAAGGFDEAMFAYLEDVDLGIRLRMAGARCASAPGTFAWHEHSAFWRSGSAPKNRRMGDSRGHLCWKYGRDLTAAEKARGWIVDGVVYAGQLVIDRNAGALRGRIEGWRRRRRRPRPGAHRGFETVPREPLGVGVALRRRLGRRR